MSEKIYHAFISYSHKDKMYATIIQRSIETLGLPFYKLWNSDVNIFRDERKIPLADSLSEQIIIGLKDSQFLIVIASKNSADSKWVKEEILNWYDLNKDEEGFITNFNFILIDNIVEWDHQNHDFDKLKTTALPKFEKKFFRTLPIWANLQDYCRSNKIQTRNSNYEWEIAKIKGLLLNKKPGEIINEASAARRTFRTIAGVVIIVLAFLAIYSYIQKQEALSQKNIANENSIKNQNSLGLNAKILSRNEVTLDIALSSVVNASTQIGELSPAKLLEVQEGLTSVVSRLEERPSIVGAESLQSFDFLYGATKLICADLSGHISVLNIKTGHLEKTMGEGAPGAGIGSSLRFNGGELSPNEELYIGSRMNNGIQVWDIKKEKKIVDIAIPPIFNRLDDYLSVHFTSLAYQVSGDSKFLVAALPSSVKIFRGKGTFSRDGFRGATSIGLWNLLNGKLESEIPVRDEMVTSVAISPSTKLIAVGTLDGTVYIYNRETKLLETKIINSVPNKNYTINQVAFTTGDTTLVAGANDGYLKLWNITGAKAQLLLKKKIAGSIENETEEDEGKKEVEPFSFKMSPNKSKAIVLNNGECNLLGLDAKGDYRPLNRNEELNYMKDVAFSPDGLLAATLSAKMLRIWDAKQGFLLKQVPFLSRDMEDIKFLPVKLGYTVVMNDHSDLFTWTYTGGNFIKILRGDARYIGESEKWYGGVSYGWDGNERSLDFKKMATSEQGKWIAATTEMGVLHILNRNGEIVSTIKNYVIDKNEPLYFTDAEKYILAKTLDDELLLADVASGKVEKTFNIKPEEIPNNSFETLQGGQIDAYSISPDGLTIALARETLITKKKREEFDQAQWDLNKKYTIQLIDVKTGKVRKELNGHKKRVRDLAFSNDGKILASAGEDSMVMLWNREQDYICTVLKGHTDLIWHVSFSKNSKKLISASKDSTATIWDVTKKEIIKRLKMSTIVSNAKFSKTSDYCLLMAGNTISVWDNASWSEMYRFIVHDEQHIINAEFLDDNTLVSLGIDGALKIYPFSIDLWHKKATEYADLILDE